MGFPGGLVVRSLPANAGDPSTIPGLGESPGVRNIRQLTPEFLLENSMDRGA